MDSRYTRSSTKLHQFYIISSSLWWTWFVRHNVRGSSLYISESDVHIYDCPDWIHLGILCLVERTGRNGFADITELFVFITVKTSDVSKKTCSDQFWALVCDWNWNVNFYVNVKCMKIHRYKIAESFAIQYNFLVFQILYHFWMLTCISRFIKICLKNLQLLWALTADKNCLLINITNTSYEWNCMPYRFWVYFSLRVISHLSGTLLQRSTSQWLVS